MLKLWKKVTDQLSREVGEEEQLTWLRPLSARQEGDQLIVSAPNAHVERNVRKSYLERIATLAKAAQPTLGGVQLVVGSAEAEPVEVAAPALAAPGTTAMPKPPMVESRIDRRYSFENFVEGTSNRLAKASALQVATRAAFYNPLVMYGGTGLGKTHLLHAIGNHILKERPDARVLYVRSEDFYNGMVRALQQGQIEAFKSVYRTLETLLIDDVQFFAGKDRTQEEFFHTFNVLYDAKQQIVLTCDRYPKELDRLEQRLKSRFGWGLSVAVEPPDFETRTAILMQKAQEIGVAVPQSGAELIAQRMRTSASVRDLEGALYTLKARSNLVGATIDADFISETLRDQFSVAERQLSPGNIQKVTGEFYRIPLSDLLGKKRTRQIARARQVAMALCKTHTTMSLKDIGQSFGGRDHTTVLHACKVIEELRRTEASFVDEWDMLTRRLSV